MANHSAVVDKLALKNIYSAYHRYFNQVQGKEDHPTFSYNATKINHIIWTIALHQKIFTTKSQIFKLDLSKIGFNIVITHQ